MDAYEAGKIMLCGDYTQYTPTGASLFQKKGRWSKLPSVGSIQYNYNKSTGRISHVAAVIECEIDYLNKVFTTKTIEGNTSSKSWENNGGMVAEKIYSNIPFDSVGNGTENHIQGFGNPIFSNDTCSVNDFLKALEGEVGYIEKATSSQNGNIEEAATSSEKIANKGTNNFTKYGKWYGQNGVAWCQQFISWCAWYACKLAKSKKWVKNGDYWYYNENGVYVKNSWRYIDGRWYVFDGEGKMITGWFKQYENEWYYLADDGGMIASQWVYYKNHWYYFTKSGVMATNVYIKDRGMYCFVDEEGAWNDEYVKNPGPGAEVIE